MKNDVNKVKMNETLSLKYTLLDQYVELAGFETRSFDPRCMRIILSHQIHTKIKFKKSIFLTVMSIYF